MKPFTLADPRQLMALGFGAGLIPRMPGTAGTLAAAPLVWFFAQLPLLGQLAAVAVAFGVGCWVCDVTARAIGVHDHPAIVWDEVVGLMVTCLAVPMSVPVLIAGVLLFRFFDILKPWPIRWLDQHVHGGVGIMIDDVLAGIFAAACLQGALLLRPLG